MINRVARVYIFILSIYHIFSGLASICFTRFSLSFNCLLYDFHAVLDDQLFLVSKPWGALAAFAGIAGLFAAKDPLRYRGNIWGLVILLLIRAGYRILYAERIHAVLKTALYRNYLSVSILLVGVGLLLAWLYKNKNVR